MDFTPEMHQRIVQNMYPPQDSSLVPRAAVSHPQLHKKTFTSPQSVMQPGVIPLSPTATTPPVTLNTIPINNSNLFQQNGNTRSSISNAKLPSSSNDLFLDLPPATELTKNTNMLEEEEIKPLHKKHKIRQN